MGKEKLQRLPVGKMPLSPTNAFFQMKGIAAFLQHVFVIICLQECGMTLPEMPDQVLAGRANIREHPNDGGAFPDDKAVWIGRIVELRKRCDRQSSYGHGTISAKSTYKMLLQLATPVLQSIRSDIHWQLIFPGNDRYAFDMVVMLVRDKYRFHGSQGQPQPSHTFLRFTAGQARIDKNSLLIITDVIAVAITARIK